MGDTASMDILFRPFKFGNKVLRNRIVMAPMTRSKSPGRAPGDDVVSYYRRRAEGECGLIITEGTVVGIKRRTDIRTCRNSSEKNRWPAGKGWPMPCMKQAA